ncbi:UDP-N-acetylenolpyruvoylglucosamine reductase [Candidatus Wolfebacteria bacterium RIFCSPLOWO2_01_FULL_38_11]|uniref:UDP-N-acetylenolpyruvoylglucosamine reductase n=2 Tax=Candidatus Wolfeibacteriota TaxID=1752735 RepID=A0A0G0J1Y7_9BACT|nr:MAG: UDP-N-acetylenolpyruvoylglucosamine reductase [Candidatus Wolfebacteria bacterium GW2011_GWC1_37_10]OGM90463.1 MAG: UDP-N-acetylenolpyruvoylglucosamine reductase [Candidatus Wolfebacteria bacterium RIFCSPLOWO2_01_FULL_38_11]
MFDQNVLLKQISHYKIGGHARYFFETDEVDKLAKSIEKARKIKAPIFVLAGSTNVLIGDKGFDGLILRPNFNFIENNDGEVVAGAGTLMSDLLEFVLGKNFSGLEWAAGLPGTVGGAVRGNAGAFGQEIKNIIESVVSLDILEKQPRIVKRTVDECLFNYRSSIFKENRGREVIIEAVFKLRKGDRQSLMEESEKNLNYRLANHPMEYPSLGSTFKNIPLSSFKNRKFMASLPIKSDPFPIVPAAYLISEAGLKGVSFGGAMISPKHPNFIVNVLDATSKDVENLIKLAKNAVKKKFNIELEEEIERI